ncbi:hypothetical protein CPC16_009918 [Podila verticillata]|nr:hypothetical protein BGZ52_002364 [Haplosporangium bisporale]KAF9381274.1 hypothetical protein CPC16_009918 [Podila verticillata]KAI9231638.1 MAG: NADH dehydrogenase 1 alpha subcomplex assembly factor 3 [Podila humilis]
MLSLIKGSARPLACLIPRTSSVLSTRSFHHAFTPYQQQNQSQHDNQIPTGLRQKNIPTPGANEDADSAISGFMNMFNEKDSKTVTISSCTKHGFVTTEAINLQGPVLCIGGQVFLWDIFQKDGAVDRARKAASSSGTPLPTRPIFESMDEATAKEIFKIFQLMNPRPEILIVGTGKVFGPLSPAVRSVIRGYGLQVDMMSTANAAATYNMLAEEGREVAAALLPLEPSTVQIVKGNQ